MQPIPTTKCPKCQLVGFEMATEKPIGAIHNFTFIRCVSCKTAIGVVEPESISGLIRSLACKLNINLGD